MENKEWLKNYNRLNNSFKKKLVFRIGVEAGFFSEFNNMVLAILYCLKHKIKFELYSDKANFAPDHGWENFFMPFCVENKAAFNAIYNVRPYHVTGRKHKYIAEFYKMLYGINYLTQDLWPYYRQESFANEFFDQPELGWQQATLLRASESIINNIWHYNSPSLKVIDEFKENLNLPEKFISIHIRAGDKYLESNLHGYQEYMAKATEITTCKNAFILTDDYMVIEDLLKIYPKWNFYSLCQPDERGYYFQDFLKKSKEEKDRLHLKLFASMDICASGQSYIGTFSSNPGMFIGMRKGENFCHGVDYSTWRIW